MFLIGDIKPIVEKKFKNCFFYATVSVFRGGELRPYKIKADLFLYAIGLLAATKTLSKRGEKNYYLAMEYLISLRIL